MKDDEELRSACLDEFDANELRTYRDGVRNGYINAVSDSRWLVRNLLSIIEEDDKDLTRMLSKLFDDIGNLMGKRLS